MIKHIVLNDNRKLFEIYKLMNCDKNFDFLLLFNFLMNLNKDPNV